MVAGLRVPRAYALLILALGLPPSGQAGSIHVPDDYPTIQDAIVAASTGDTVLVRPGTYVENINYLGKSIALISEAGPTATIIDGSNPAHPDTGTVVTIPPAPVDPMPLLQGFTITGGTGSNLGGLLRRAGGIAMFTPAIIHNNWITENHIQISDPGHSAHAGAILIDHYPDGGAMISDNRIFSNSALTTVGGRGGAIRIAGNGGDNSIEGNEIFDNTVGDMKNGNGTGGGIYTDTAFYSVRHNVIACNRAGKTGGGMFAWCRTIESNTVVANEAESVGGVEGNVFSSGSFARNSITHNVGLGRWCRFAALGSCNNYFANTEEDSLCFQGVNNISVDPLYGDEGCGASYCLSPDSPLLPENSPPECGLIGARGVCATTSIEDLNAPTSPDYASSPLVARPNPFNPSTTVSFRLDRDSVIELQVVDTQGRVVAELHRGFLTEGKHHIRWDGRDRDGDMLASGAYIAVLRSPAARYSQKLLLIK